MDLMFCEMLFNAPAAKQIAKDKQAREEARRNNTKQGKSQSVGYNGPYPSSPSPPTPFGGGGADLVLSSSNPTNGNKNDTLQRQTHLVGGEGEGGGESTAIVLRPSPTSVHPGPVARDTLPLRVLFSEHIAHVSQIPLVLNNMPVYYAIVSSALDRALEEADFVLRKQSLARGGVAVPGGRLDATDDDDDDDEEEEEEEEDDEYTL